MLEATHSFHVLNGAARDYRNFPPALFHVCSPFARDQRRGIGGLANLAGIELSFLAELRDETKWA